MGQLYLCFSLFVWASLYGFKSFSLFFASVDKMCQRWIWYMSRDVTWVTGQTWFSTVLSVNFKLLNKHVVAPCKRVWEKVRACYLNTLCPQLCVVFGVEMNQNLDFLWGERLKICSRRPKKSSTEGRGVKSLFCLLGITLSALSKSDGGEACAEPGFLTL